MRILVYLSLLTAVATVVPAAEVRTLDFSLHNERETACEEVVRVSLPVPTGLVPGEPPHLIPTFRRSSNQYLRDFRVGQVGGSMAVFSG